MTQLQLLLDTLEDLSAGELKKLQLYLTSGELKGFCRILKANLENRDSTDTAKTMRDAYGDHGALRITLLILKEMKHNNLADKLERELEKMSSGSRESTSNKGSGYPPPGPIKFTSVKQNSVSLSWGAPEGLVGHQKYRVTWSCEGDQVDQVDVSNVGWFTVGDLKAVTEYEFTVATLMDDGSKSSHVSARTYTEIPKPDDVNIASDLTSLSVTWSKPAGVDEVSYLVSLHSDGECLHTFSRKSLKHRFDGLLIGKEYSISVCAVLKKKSQSDPIIKNIWTRVPAPEKLSVDLVETTTANLSWSLSDVMDQTPHNFLISYCIKKTDQQTISTGSCSVVITGLKPGTDCIVNVFTKTQHGGQSQPSEITFHIAVPSPEQLKVVSVTPTSIDLTWSPPHGMDQTPHSYQISYLSGGSDSQTISTESCNVDITGLKPYTDYSVSIRTKLNDGEMSEPVKEEVCTAVPCPGNLTVVSVTPTSAELTWSPPRGMDQTPHSYQVSYHKGGSHSEPFSTHSCSAIIEYLEPCTDHMVIVYTKLKDGGSSEPARKLVHTAVAAPKQLTVVSVTPTSVHLTWLPPHGMDHTPYSYQISGGTEPLTISKDSCSAVITGLNPYTNYSVSICTKVTDDEMSEAARTAFRTMVPVPEQVIVVSVTPTSAELKWNPPHGIDQTPESYQISYQKEGARLKTISANSCCSNITGLNPCTSYAVSIRVKLKDGGMSEAVGTVVHTGTPVPQKLKVASVTPTSVKLTWNPPHGMDQTPHSYQISYHSERTECKTTSRDSCSADITGLKPCTDYVVRVCTKPNNNSWRMSEAVEIKVPTTVPAPEQLTVVSVTPTSAHLTWLPPHGMDQTPHSYHISWSRKGAHPLTISTDLCSAVITSLQPDTDYIISVCAKPKDERMSELVKKIIHTEILTRNYYTIVIGNTQNHHQALKGMLINKSLREVKHVENCDLILAFCGIMSRVGTEMEAALKEIPDCKPAVLAVMHHTFHPDHVTPDTSRFVRGRNIVVVDILFHEDKGILRCQKNTEAQSKMLEMVWACSEPGGPKKLLPPRLAQPPQATPHTKTDAPKNSASYSVPSQHGHSSEMVQKSHGYKIKSERKEKAIASYSPYTEVRYSAIVSGNTLGADKDFKKRLTDKVVLPKEVSLAAQCNFLLVFCPIVSSVGSDIEKALKQIPDGKPHILVVMHHTFNAQYEPPDTKRYARDKDMIIVDCLFYEDAGLLKCQRNDEALDYVSKWLQGKFPNVVGKSQNVSWTSLGGFFSRR